MSGKKEMVHYDLATKLEALRLHEEEGLSYREVSQRLGIRKVEIRTEAFPAFSIGKEACCPEYSGTFDFFLREVRPFR